MFAKDLSAPRVTELELTAAVLTPVLVMVASGVQFPIIFTCPVALVVAIPGNADNTKPKVLAEPKVPAPTKIVIVIVALQRFGIMSRALWIVRHAKAADEQSLESLPVVVT